MTTRGVPCTSSASICVRYTSTAVRRTAESVRRAQTRAVHRRHTRGIRWLLLVLLGSILPQPLPGLAQPVVIKFATLAPEGTPWMNTMEEMNRELQEKSAGQL